MLIEGVIAATCTMLNVVVEPVVPVIHDNVGFVQLNEQLFGAYDPKDVTLGAVAVWPTVTMKECTATVSFRNPLLYVSSELKRYPCAFNHVMKHEIGHITIYNMRLKSIEGATIPVESHVLWFKRFFDSTRQLHRHHDRRTTEENIRACNGIILEILDKPDSTLTSR